MFLLNSVKRETLVIFYSKLEFLNPSITNNNKKERIMLKKKKCDKK